MKKNSYDETKKMLNTLRNLNESRQKDSKILKEQYSEPETYADQDAEATHWELERDARSDMEAEKELANKTPEAGQPNEDSDYTVINDVEIVIHSEDPEDLELNDEEKGKISQLIDDFRAEVAETVEFGRMDIYEASGKLTGQIGEYGIQFTLSTGDDTGLYLNGQMLKIDENSLSVISKLHQYQSKYSSTINDLLVRRQTT